MKVRNLTVFAGWGLGAGLALAVGLGTIAIMHHRGTSTPAQSAQDTKSDQPDFEAEAMKIDQQDYEVMQPVCTPCHSAGFILHSRSWSSWQGIFDQMSGYGAQATQDEWNHIYRYTAHNLTLIDVNHADEDELSAVLGVDEKTAIAMVERRSDHKFQSASDVEAVPGVNKAVIEAMKPRLMFDEVSEGQ